MNKYNNDVEIVMKNSLKLLVLASIASIVGCTYGTGSVQYRKYNMYTSANAGNMKYEEVMTISESARGFVWDSCDVVASKTASVMYDRAIASGGNALIDVKWFAENGVTRTATCKTAYGFFALYIVGGLGPWVKSAQAEAIVVKLNNKELKNLSQSNNENIIILGNKEDFLKSLRL